MFTDHEVIAAASTERITAHEAAGRRVYVAAFENAAGSVETRTFAVADLKAARLYAREYAARILAGRWRVIDVRWGR